MGLIFNIKLLQCSRGWSQVGHTAGRPFVVHGWGIPARTLGPGNKRTVYNTQDSHQKEEKPRSQKKSRRRRNPKSNHKVTQDSNTQEVRTSQKNRAHPATQWHPIYSEEGTIGYNATGKMFFRQDIYKG